jgi:hypothetical protein
MFIQPNLLCVFLIQKVIINFVFLKAVESGFNNWRVGITGIFNNLILLTVFRIRMGCNLQYG